MIGETISHYKIIEKLSESGMSVVYKAEDTKLKRKVVLKFLPSHLTIDKQIRERFEREARAAASLNHPNIVTIHEISEFKDQVYIVMEYVDGMSLREKIMNSTLTIHESLDITGQISQGLSKAHVAGIVHRDIKPENILIDSEGRVKILDFGIAKLKGAGSLTKENSTLGTVNYMSPEQVRGENVDHKSDIWSLGVVFYEMLTGRLPFNGEYEQAVMYTIINEEPEMSDFNKLGIPQKLKKIIAKMLNKIPEKRFQSCAQVNDYIYDKKEMVQIDYRGKYKIQTLLSLPKIPGKYWLAMSILIILFFIFIVWYYFIKPPVSLGSSDYIVVADFENKTDKDVFNHSLTEAMRVTLGQSRYVSVLSRFQISDALVRMNLPTDQYLDEKISLAVARRENARIVVAGNINQLGKKFVLISKIIDALSGETCRLRRIEVDKIEDVLNGMDKLVKNIRKDLGESLNLISKSSMPLVKVTTSSIEALELYSRANILDAQGKYAEAIELMEQAIAIDSLFTMAVSNLSYNYHKIGNYKRAMYYHKRVLPLIDRVTDKEKFFILTLYYGPTFEYDYKKAFQYGRQYILLYPNDAIGHATLGHLAMFADDYQTALQSNKKALELDSSLAKTCYSNSGFANALAGNTSEAYHCFKKSKKLRPTYLALDGYIAQVLWMAGKLDSAEIVFKSILPDANLMRKAKTHVHLAALYHFQGKLQNAFNQCLEGIKVCQELNRPEHEAYFHYLMAEIESDRGHISEYLKEMKKSIQLVDIPFYEFVFVGESYARNGVVDKALQIGDKLQSIESDDPLFNKRCSTFINFIKGELALNSSNYEKALQHFNGVVKLYSGDPIFWLAQKKIACCTFNIDVTKAIQNYDKIFNHRGEIFMAFLPSVRNGGLWTSRLWPEMLFELGKCYAVNNDTIRAVESWQRVRTYWQNADHDFKKYDELKKLLNKFRPNMQHLEYSQ